MTDIPKAARRYTLKGRELKVLVWYRIVPMFAHQFIGVRVGGGKTCGPRNVMIEFIDNGEQSVRSFRGLRRIK